ncbi:MAG: chromate transporter [Treponema sp.]|nr:chromate transporter [Treponema sp.]
MNLLQLFLTFFYVGTFTIGGGLVGISVMQQVIVEKGLLTPEKFFNMVAISESTPGPIGINMATYIGCEMYGIFGGVITTVGYVLPSLICITIIAKYFRKFQEKPLVQAAFFGLRPAVSGMIAVAAWNVIAITVVNFARLKDTGIWYNLFNFPSLVFYIIALFILLKTKLHPLFVILAGAIFGILVL